MEIYSGAPQDISSRSDREKRTYAKLDELGIKYERCDHDRAEDMDACAEIEKAIGTEICKNLFLCNRQKTDFYLLMMPPKKPFKTKDITKQLECSRLSFATADHMLDMLDITPGSVSVLGLMNDKDCRIQLVIDEDLLKNKYIGCHPCENSSTLKIKTQDIMQIFLPDVKHKPVFVNLPDYEQE